MFDLSAEETVALLSLGLAGDGDGRLSTDLAVRSPRSPPSVLVLVGGGTGRLLPVRLCRRVLDQ